MRQILLLTFLLTASCYDGMQIGCIMPSQYRQEKAQRLYNTFGTKLAKNITSKKARKLFGCHYHQRSDYIYAYENIWGEKEYILVRYGKPIISTTENPLEPI